MRAEPDKSNSLSIFINPYEEEIILNMTFHAALIFTGKHMRFECGINSSPLLQLT